jgi:SAM-dependent methyltransferase
MPHPAPAGPWTGAWKLPWDDPAFSRRMLAEHLTQDHDLASRRLEWIHRQVAWIHHHLLAARPASILDLACGPGLYSHRLSALGHHCRGIDFAPASINYARRFNPHPSRCEFVLGDLRRIPYGGPYRLAMLLYGEMNVFSPGEILAILQAARASLLPSHGALILEVQAPEAVERAGRAGPFEEHLPSGLFSDHPYHCLTENQWLPEHQVAVQTYTIRPEAGPPRVYRNTTRAWTDAALAGLLHAAGFRQISLQPAWPCNTPALALWSAVAPQ